MKKYEAPELELTPMMVREMIANVSEGSIIEDESDWGED